MRGINSQLALAAAMVIGGSLPNTGHGFSFPVSKARKRSEQTPEEREASLEKLHQAQEKRDRKAAKNLKNKGK